MKHFSQCLLYVWNILCICFHMYDIKSILHVFSNSAVLFFWSQSMSVSLSFQCLSPCQCLSPVDVSLLSMSQSCRCLSYAHVRYNHGASHGAPQVFTFIHAETPQLMCCVPSTPCSCGLFTEGVGMEGGVGGVTSILACTLCVCVICYRHIWSLEAEIVFFFS